MKLLWTSAWILAFSIWLPQLSGAHDADHPGVYHQWFESLRLPGTEGDGAYGVGCCGVADCHVVSARVDGKGWQIYAENKWWGIPQRAILDKHDNPTGGAVACWVGKEPTPKNILCFVVPFLT